MAKKDDSTSTDMEKIVHVPKSVADERILGHFKEMQ